MKHKSGNSVIRYYTSVGCQTRVRFITITPEQEQEREEQVWKTMAVIIPVILEHLEDDGTSPVEIATLENVASVSRTVFNEALGRLKAIGFISERKRYVKAKRDKRTDGKEYYYDVDVESHPIKLGIEETIKRLLKRRQRLDRISESNREAFSMENIKAFDMAYKLLYGD